MGDDARRIWQARRREFLLGSGLSMAAIGLGEPVHAQGVQGEVVATCHGPVRGVQRDGVKQFLGLRYGADTGGPNRFLPPKQPAPWTHVQDAVAYGPSCPQVLPEPGGPGRVLVEVFSGMTVGAPVSENCLRLNLWTPGADKAARAVMVWLHGGGFNLNSASAPVFDGARLARRQDVVVIGINHRLNVFGFSDVSQIFGEAYAHSGNAGMLDIVAALQWVRDNVAQFGGDPGNVTVFGESGGGQKVACLLGMPAAKGLFHKAIMQSAPSVAHPGQEASREAAGALLSAAGGADALKSLPPAALVEAYRAAIVEMGRKRPGTPSFVPVIDGQTLPLDPLRPEVSPLADRIPLMIGSNRHETNFFTIGNQNLAMSEAQLLGALRQSQPKLDPADLIAACRAENPAASPWDMFVRIGSEALAGVQARAVADRKARQAAPVFAYRFDWATPALGGHMGAFHGLEIPFVFDTLEAGRPIIGDVVAAQPLADAMSAAWAGFARTGRPSAPGLPDWPSYSDADRRMMVFGTQSRVVADPSGPLRMLLARR